MGSAAGEAASWLRAACGPRAFCRVRRGCSGEEVCGVRLLDAPGDSDVTDALRRNRRGKLPRTPSPRLFGAEVDSCDGVRAGLAPCVSDAELDDEVDDGLKMDGILGEPMGWFLGK